MTRLSLVEIDVQCAWVQQKDCYTVETKMNCVVETEMSHTIKSKSKLPLYQIHGPPKFKYMLLPHKWELVTPQHQITDTNGVICNMNYAQWFT